MTELAFGAGVVVGEIIMAAVVWWASRGVGPNF